MDSFAIVLFNDTDVMLIIYFGSQAIKEDLNSAQPNLQAIKATADELEQVSTQHCSKHCSLCLTKNNSASKMLRNCSSDGVKLKHVFYFAVFSRTYNFLCCNCRSVVCQGAWNYKNTWRISRMLWKK